MHVRRLRVTGAFQTRKSTSRAESCGENHSSYFLSVDAVISDSHGQDRRK